jgi:hypothetical protein
MKGKFRWESKLYDGVRDFVKYNGWDLYHQICGTNIFETIQEQWALFDTYSPSKVPNQFEGLAQGSPISPLLSILILKEFAKQVHTVFYADDWIAAANKPFQIKEDQESGIKIHTEKSG